LATLSPLRAAAGASRDGCAPLGMPGSGEAAGEIGLLLP